jgi:hypothetical protein
MSDTVEARLTLRIPRGGPRGLYEGAVERLGRAAIVDAIDDLDVTDVRPGLNDLRVEATATLACDDTAESPQQALVDAVGVESCEIVGDGSGQ